MTCLKDNFDIGVLLDGGRFETIAPLDHGSFGMVFTAKDLTTHQTVAIKCLTKPTSSQSTWTDTNSTHWVDNKFEELSLHSRLGLHPNIVNLLHSFETTSHVFLVLEFCPRGDLYEAIRNGQGPLETERVRQAMLELVDAVSFMHSKGIYHRDIKPENIFLTQSGNLKLGDFGLGTTSIWTHETTVGSDRYMSPEQFDSAGDGYSPAQADIWAIGICLLNILFARNPFTTPTEADPIFLDYSRDKQALFDIFPSMSQNTFEIIVECMSLDPRKRSLTGVRRALIRAVNFTTSNEVFDDYCTADLKPGATSNREPLRTPSIQSPHVHPDAFPWSKTGLLRHSRSVHQLYAIPDDEVYSEDLFPLSEQSVGDWCSTVAQTPSMSSILNSQLGASVDAVSMHQPTRHGSALHAGASHVAASLPITMAQTRDALSVFSSRKPSVSKSWNDMWYDDMLEGDQAQQPFDDDSFPGSCSPNLDDDTTSRLWSHGSQPEQAVHPVEDFVGTKTDDSDSSQLVFSGDIDSDLVRDGFFSHEVPAKATSGSSTPRYATTSRPGNLDKWAALGERRRAINDVNDFERSPERSPLPLKIQRLSGHENYGSLGTGPTSIWDSVSNSPKWTKDRARERGSWVKARAWNWRKDRRNTGLGDVDWVNGWQDTRS